MTSLDWCSAACRFLHYLTALVVFGTLAFQTIAPRRLSRAVDRLSRWTFAIGAATSVPTTLAWLMLQSAEAGDGWSDASNPDMIGLLLTRTEFGAVWGCHLVLALALSLSLLVPGPHRRIPVRIIATCYLASLALVGHAAMRSGLAGFTLRLSHVAHLLAAGFWLGALPPLVLALGWLGHRSLGTSAAAVLWRFSGIGHIAVMIIVVSGVCNAWLILGSASNAQGSSYATLLVVKVALVALMIGLAVVNRCILTPRLNERGMHRWIRATAISEVGLGYAVVGVVSVLGIQSPTG